MTLQFAWAMPAGAEPEGPYFVKGTRVNLRQTPAGEVVKELSGGEKLFVMDRDGDWRYVSLPVLGLKGWVHSDFVEKTAQVQPPIQAEGDVIDEPVAIASTDTIDVVIAGQCIDPAAGANPKPIAVATPQKTETSFKNVALTSPGKLGSAKYRSVAGPELASISAENVNLRKTPTLNAEVVGKAEQGERAYIITNNDPWYLVSLPDRELKGWVFGEYVDVQPRVEIKADDVRLRESPSLDGRVKEQLARGDVFYKVSAKDGWVQVASSASGLSGWVKADYVVRSKGSVSRPYKVSGDQVNFRASPAVDADVIARLPAGSTVNVLGRSEKWAYAWFDGHKGWLYTEYLDELDGGAAIPGPDVERKNTHPTGRTLSWKEVGGASIGNRLIERARAMMGTPYVWGGESDNGVDCSGLIYKVLCDEGVEAKCLPRRASEQMAQLGLSVEKEELAAGDLVFFTTYKDGASHVGIYLGDGDFIHASSAQHRVTVSNLSEGYYRKRFVGARRITEEQLKSMQ
ncbi:MAG: SH3 domain-containing protein [bacterium]|nr:SH3 domain-containing protein [bacterium]